LDGGIPDAILVGKLGLLLAAAGHPVDGVTPVVVFQIAGHWRTDNQGMSIVNSTPKTSNCDCDILLLFSELFQALHFVSFNLRSLKGKSAPTVCDDKVIFFSLNTTWVQKN
jgi:hypothetical protein